MKRWFSNLSKAGRITVVAVLTVVGIGSISAVAQQNQAQRSTVPAVIQAQKAQQSKEKIDAEKITTKEVTETQSIAFETVTIDDATLERGTTKTITEGVAGERTITYTVAQKDGIETSRTEKSNTITTQPVNKVVHNGTKAPAPSCPNGSYINSAGNTVCRPAESDSVPAGATAQCSDGSYSYSQSRRGTCSHHGGVSRWL